MLAENLIDQDFSKKISQGIGAVGDLFDEQVERLELLRDAINKVSEKQPFASGSNAAAKYRDELVRVITVLK